MVNTIGKNLFEVDLNFHPIRLIRFRNSDPPVIDQITQRISMANIKYNNYLLRRFTVGKNNILIKFRFRLFVL